VQPTNACGSPVTHLVCCRSHETFYDCCSLLSNSLL